MLYWLLRWIAATALRWYYRDIRVVGTENIPLKGPVIFAVNHPNALVDALVAGTVIRRRIRLTGKATLFERPALALFLRWAGVVPLRRASDEARHGRNGLTPARNAESFRELGDVLSRGGAMLIFPEGKSHSEPRLAPLKTGIARIALEARDVRGVRGLTIVPIGLIFERKEKPRSRVVVQVGEPVSVDELAESGTGAVASLTRMVDDRLRAVTLNFESGDHAKRVAAVADLVAGVSEPLRVVGKADPDLLTVLQVIQRVERARIALETGQFDEQFRGRVEEFLQRLDEFERELHAHGVAAPDVKIETGVIPAAQFALRESLIALLVGPAAGWGRINHWLPFRGARAIAGAGSRDADQPAMRALVAGLVLVLAAYAVQTTIVWALAGGLVAMAYLVTLPAFAIWDLRLSDRSRRARSRIRSYFLFRHRPSLRGRLVAESEWLRHEATELEAALTGGEAEGLTTRPVVPGRGGMDRSGPSATQAS